MQTFKNKGVTKLAKNKYFVLILYLSSYDIDNQTTICSPTNYRQNSQNLMVDKLENQSNFTEGILNKNYRLRYRIVSFQKIGFLRNI